MVNRIQLFKMSNKIISYSLAQHSNPLWYLMRKSNSYRVKKSKSTGKYGCSLFPASEPLITHSCYGNATNRNTEGSGDIKEMNQIYPLHWTLFTGESRWSLNMQLNPPCWSRIWIRSKYESTDSTFQWGQEGVRPSLGWLGSWSSLESESYHEYLGGCGLVWEGVR